MQYGDKQVSQPFKKRILFVIPSYSHAVIDLHASPVKVVPFGVLSLASYIGHYCPWVECEILDFNIESQDTSVQYAVLKSKIIEFKPDIVGLSIMYNACKDQIAPLAEIIKDIIPDTILIAGGIMATNMPEEIFGESPLVDAVCFGEGEIPVRDLLCSNDPHLLFQEHPSWILHHKARDNKQPSQSFVINLDEIPPIHYSLVAGKEYTSQFRNKDGEDGFALPMHSTRGCPFNCIFCCSAANHGRKIRSMSASRFLRDVEQMIKEYKITRLSIDDDQFLFHRDRAKEILIGLAHFGIEIEMANGLTVRFIDDEMASLLKNAGLKIAVLAIESGSQRVLKEIIDKPLKLNEVSGAVKALRKQNLSIHSFFIIGFPGETAQDRKLTRDFIVSTGFDWNGIFIATPFPGSRLYDLCREKGYISQDCVPNSNIFECQINAPHIDPKGITRDAYLLNLDVNFVNNYNMSAGMHKKAAGYFDGIAKRYPNHAFVHYFLAKALQCIPDRDLISVQNHYQRYKEIISTDKMWRDYAEFFDLPEIIV
jgi:anaerobic magnesium-protoporphyrin IX monomethyl ester cyclase